MLGCQSKDLHSNSASSERCFNSSGPLVPLVNSAEEWAHWPYTVNGKIRQHTHLWVKAKKMNQLTLHTDGWLSGLAQRTPFTSSSWHPLTSLGCGKIPMNVATLPKILDWINRQIQRHPPFRICSSSSSSGMISRVVVSFFGSVARRMRWIVSSPLALTAATSLSSR